MRKKLLSICGLLFVGAVLLAQGNNSTVTQTGTNHDASISQTGSANTSEVSQIKTDYTYYGSGIDADITQTGSQNESYVNQSMGAYGGGNRTSADVTQDGAQNLLNLDQNGVGYQSAIIIQQGVSNESDVVQAANYSNSYIEQVGEVAGQNYAHQRFAASNVEGRILQFGDNNTAYQSMPYTPPVKNSFMESEQTGSGNYSEQQIVGDEWGFADGDNSATIDQMGNDNSGFQAIVGRTNSEIQDINGSENEIYQSQNGDRNSSRVKVKPEDSYVGNNNYVSTTQIIKGSKAWVTLHGSNNDVELSQTGNDGDWHVVKVMKGDANTVDIVAENGSGNRGYWLMRWASSDNSITVSQDGSGNIAGGYLEGTSSNVIDIFQSGSDNLVGSDPGNWNVNDGVVIMNGSGNSVDIDQLTDGNMATANVVGSSNTVTVSQ